MMTSCCHSNRTKHQARERTLFSYITIPQCVLLIHVIVTVNLYCMFLFQEQIKSIIEVLDFKVSLYLKIFREENSFERNSDATTVILLLYFIMLQG